MTRPSENVVEGNPRLGDDDDEQASCDREGDGDSADTGDTDTDNDLHLNSESDSDSAVLSDGDGGGASDNVCSDLPTGDDKAASDDNDAGGDVNVCEQPAAVAPLDSTLASVPEVEALAPAPAARSSSSRTTGGVPRAPKQFTSPVETLVLISPHPYCIISLNANDHRFVSKWRSDLKPETWIDELARTSFSKSFAADSEQSWKSALRAVHERVWTKYDLNKQNMPISMEPQTPGHVPESVFSQISEVIATLPARKDYVRWSFGAAKLCMVEKLVRGEEGGLSWYLIKASASISNWYHQSRHLGLD